MIINYISPEGISLVREEIKLEWAEDSLFTDETSDSEAIKVDSAQYDLNSENLSPKKSDSDIKVKVNKQSDSTSPPPQKTDKNVSTNTTKEETIEFSAPKAVNLEQAYVLFNKGVLFIDARDESDYLAGHISNSINIPFDDIDNHKQKLLSISKNKPIVIYCAGTECDLSILLGNKLFEEGYKQVYIFFGGWGEWIEADYPVEHQSDSNVK